MKTKITLYLMIILIVSIAGSTATAGKRFKMAKYSPVVNFVDEDSTLAEWFKQYINTTRGKVEFKDFLERLGKSEILYQRSKRVGLTHNQLYSPLITLTEKELNKINELSNQEIATIRLAMLELDIALATIEGSLPDTACEELRREVLRGARPLSGVAKLPRSATEAMTFTLGGHVVSERLNTSEQSKSPPAFSEIVNNPQNENVEGVKKREIVKPNNLKNIFKIW